MGAAEVRIKRRLNIAVLAQFGEHLFHQRLALVRFCGSCVVEFIQTVQAQPLPVHNFIIAGQVQRTGVHSVFHCHRGHLRAFFFIISKEAVLCQRPLAAAPSPCYNTLDFYRQCAAYQGEKR